MHDINVYIFDTNQFYNLKPESINAILDEIAPAYARKYRRLKDAGNLTGSLQELAAGILLSRCLGVHEDDELRLGEHGKPELVLGNVAFNLSHSGHFVVLAVADKDVGAVGVDIERTDRVRLSVAKRLFSRDVYEAAALEMERDEKAAGILFARHWTACEARLKLSGTGLGGYAGVKCDYSETDSDVRHIELEDSQYIIAVAINGNINTCEVSEEIVQYY